MYGVFVMTKETLFAVFLRAVLPAVLAAAGTTMAVLWSEGFRLFCGAA